MRGRQRTAKLGEVLDIQSGQVDPREPPYRDMWHVGGDNIASGSGELFGLRRAHECGLVSGKYEFGDQDILYSKIRPALNKVAVPQFAGICSADIYPLRARPDVLDRRFLAALLRQPEFLAFTEAHSNRTNIPKVNREALLAYEFVLPPICEQYRIADILDKADAIQRKRREALALTDELLRATFLEMFGDPVTNPRGWGRRRIDELAEVQSGLQLTATRDALPHKVPYLRVANIYRDRLQLNEVKTMGVTDAEFERARLIDGDLLIVEGHGNPEELGRCAVWNGSIDPCLHQNHLIRVRPRLAATESLYLSAFINSAAGRRQMLGHGKTTSGLNTISVSNVKSVEILCPPLEVQKKFCDLVRRIAAGVERLARGVTEADALFTSLQHRAFRGELTRYREGS